MSLSWQTRFSCSIYKWCWSAETTHRSYVLSLYFWTHLKVTWGSTCYTQKKETFIIIIDEYDVLIRENVSKENLDLYLGLLNSLFKGRYINPAISLAYITGILPIMKDGFQSKMNEFCQVNMLSIGNFAEYTGFTADEVKELCKKYRCDFEECKNEYLRRWVRLYK